jgi:hypothetical protein
MAEINVNNVSAINVNGGVMAMASWQPALQRRNGNISNVISVISMKWRGGSRQ